MPVFLISLNLKKQDKAEIQEQYIIPVERTEENRGSGKIRIRKVTSRSGDVRYELTTKLMLKKVRLKLLFLLLKRTLFNLK